MVTTLKDSGEIRIYSFGDIPSPKRPTYVATLHLPLPHYHRVLPELSMTMGPFLACPPAVVPFAVCNARAHDFILYHDPAARWGRYRLGRFVVHHWTLIQYVNVYREEINATDVAWE